MHVCTNKIVKKKRIMNLQYLPMQWSSLWLMRWRNSSPSLLCFHICSLKCAKFKKNLPERLNWRSNVVLNKSCVKLIINTKWGARTNKPRKAGKLLVFQTKMSNPFKMYFTPLLGIINVGTIADTYLINTIELTQVCT